MSGNFLKKLTELELSDLASYRAEILGAMILVAFGFFYYQFIHSGLSTEAASLKTRVSVLGSEIKTIKAEIAMISELRETLDKEKRRLELVRARLASLKERLPSDKQVSEILSDLSSSELTGGVRIVSIRPLDPEVEGELTRLPYQVQIDGGFLDFGSYIERIEGMDRVMVVDNFMLEAREQQGDAVRPLKGVPLASQLYLSTYILGGYTR